MKRIFPQSFYNVITLVSLAIAAVSFGLILFMMLLEILTAHPKPYVGIIAFVILPTFLLISLVVAALGVVREHRRERLGQPHGVHLPVVDLNNPRHRVAFVSISLGTILLLLFSAFGSFKAYEYTDSDEFCGTTCHTVMEPEFVAYQYSPHARVGCVQCHIGSGAGWYVRSKLSGAYQVYATIFDKFPRPIPTPIENLRPAQETCEQCHWPEHFFSEKLLKNTYYLSDKDNPKWELDLLIRIGGGSSEAGPTSGIHWHMNIQNELSYVSADTQRQIIQWIRSKSVDGRVTIYRNQENPLTDEEAARQKSRRMDCIDCHNRPTHIYHPAARSIDHMMSLGWIDASLPDAKSLCVRMLENTYTTKKVALDSIRVGIEEYYRVQYPQIARSKQIPIRRTIEEVQKIYERNYFPEMKVSWKEHINNIGHLYYPGCFRCHDGKHVSDDGKVLSRDCNLCHTILAQKYSRENVRISLEGIDYRHPVDIGNAWKEMNCSDCHGR